MGLAWTVLLLPSPWKRFRAPAVALAWQLPVRGITFSPSLDLDADIIQSRFGTPESVVEINTQQAHWLYPDRGLDVVLDAKGKELLQYLAPREFAAYRAGLQ